MSGYNLSVVVLVYNTAEYLVECFDSLLNQTLSDIEIIAINDGSTDHSLDICSEYEAEHSNFRLINQSNTGGATAGNRAMKLATGKYVAIIDSDDIVAEDGYEKLFIAAEKETADIAIGRPMQYRRGKASQVGLSEERAVWREAKTITSATDFPMIFFDAFYWNKIFLRKFVEEYDIRMPDGMLYADRPMVHAAYNFASKITIITDVVYFWRKRETNTTDTSITQNKQTIDNLRDRIESFSFEHDFFSAHGKPEVLHYINIDNMLRMLFPVWGIINDSLYRDAYFQLCHEFLQKIDDVPDLYFKPWQKVFLWLLKNGHYYEVLILVATKNRYPARLLNGEIYWQPPFFKDENINIPLQIYRLDYIELGHMHGFKVIRKGQELEFQVGISRLSAFKSIEDISLIFEHKSTGDTIKLESRVYGNTVSFRCLKSDFYSKGYGTYYVFVRILQHHKTEFFQLTRSQSEQELLNSSTSRLVLSKSQKRGYIKLQVLNRKGGIKQKLLHMLPG